MSSGKEPTPETRSPQSKQRTHDDPLLALYASLTESGYSDGIKALVPSDYRSADSWHLPRSLARETRFDPTSKLIYAVLYSLYTGSGNQEVFCGQNWISRQIGGITPRQMRKHIGFLEKRVLIKRRRVWRSRVAGPNRHTINLAAFPHGIKIRLLFLPKWVVRAGRRRLTAQAKLLYAAMQYRAGIGERRDDFAAKENRLFGSDVGLSKFAAQRARAALSDGKLIHTFEAKGRRLKYVAFLVHPWLSAYIHDADTEKAQRTANAPTSPADISRTREREAAAKLVVRGVPI